MVRYFDQVEADFLRYYRIDLPAALWGEQPVTLRKVSALVWSLPPESATCRRFTVDQDADPTPVSRRQVSAQDIEAFGGKVTYVPARQP